MKQAADTPAALTAIIRRYGTGVAGGLADSQRRKLKRRLAEMGPGDPQHYLRIIEEIFGGQAKLAASKDGDLYRTATVGEPPTVGDIIGKDPSELLRQAERGASGWTQSYHHGPGRGWHD